uniref:KH-like RNA-binding domain-containing protein n=1 Tax=Equus caballus TaxID=9796 RepID=F6TZF9_HORSE
LGVRARLGWVPGWLLRLLHPLPRARTRPPGFPARELSDPLVFYLEASLAASIFGPDHARIPETEWMSQALLTVDTVNPGNLVEITIFGQPIVQNWVKSLLLSLASCHPEHRGPSCEDGTTRGVLEGPCITSRLPSILLHKYCQEHYENSRAPTSKVQEQQVFTTSTFFFPDSRWVVV